MPTYLSHDKKRGYIIDLPESLTIVYQTTGVNKYKMYIFSYSILGILMSGGLMVYSMKSLTTSSLWFIAWLIAGFWIYAAYGYHQKRLEDKRKKFYGKKD